ncbi:unnamed protein product [Paramecium sonneborni]|uniref:Uncharacterized protein n=1 Tax=Paramecium sonneborni TaxID=65129 RepID=A0A8S1RP90_9CILI|nr:unnamed protein product [Paramecium sonneborni]
MHFDSKNKTDRLLVPQIINQQFIPYNFTYKIVDLNDENNQIKALEESKCVINFDVVIIRKQEVLFNTISQDYNLHQMIIIFDLDNSAYNYLQLEIT